MRCSGQPEQQDRADRTGKVLARQVAAHPSHLLRKTTTLQLWHQFPLALFFSLYLELLLVSHSVVCDSLATLWTVACQAPLLTGVPGKILQQVAIFFSGDLPNPGIEPAFPALPVDSLPLRHWERIELQYLIRHFPYDICHQFNQA